MKFNPFGVSGVTAQKAPLAPVTLLTDSRRVAVVIVIIFAGLIPVWLGLGSSILLVLLCPLILRRPTRTTLLAAAFSVAYTLPLIFNPAMGYLRLAACLVLPVAMVQAGAYLGEKVRQPRTIFLIMGALAIWFALPIIILTIKEIILTGDVVNRTRYLSATPALPRLWATMCGLMVSLSVALIGVACIPAANTGRRSLKIFLVAFSLLSLLTVVHLLNRTGLVIAAATLVACLFVPRCTRRKLVRFAIVAVVLVIAFIALAHLTHTVGEIADAYIARSHGDYTTLNLGGRLVRWAQGLRLVATHPLGTPAGVVINGTPTYAHNLWLDIGVRSGWPAMALMIWLTWLYARHSRRAILSSATDTLSKGIALCLLLGILLEATVEPVMDASLGYTTLIFLFLGLLTAYNRRTTPQ